MEQFVQCVNLEFDYNIETHSYKIIGESEIAINTRYILSAETVKRAVTDETIPFETKMVSYYLITKYDGDMLTVKKDPHLIAIFGV